MSDNQSQPQTDLSLGYAPIDDMHREFLDCCAALAAATGADFIGCLDVLSAHCVEHFGQENQWMRETGYQPAGCHVAEHESVLNILRQVREKYLAGETEIGANLAQELPLWFEHHVLSMDNMLAAFLKSHSEGASAVPVGATEAA